jgi:hypothetical protein
MNHAAIDPATNLGGGNSLKPSTSLSGTTAATGTYVDMRDCHGPCYGEFAVGSPTGTPDSFAVTCKLKQADASDGTGAEDMPIQSAALVLDAAGEAGYVRGHRSKRYVAAVATPAFTGGTSPTVNVSANVRAPKIHGG